MTLPRSIWKGAVSFGLVTIPVGLYSAVERDDLHFNLLDERDFSRIHNKRVNESTGEEVEWDNIVKGYELEDGRYVTLTDEDFRAANVKATSTIDIIGAVCRDDVPMQYFDTPYYLVPDKVGVKPYALFREALRRADRVAVGQFVFRTRQKLAILVPEGDALLLDVIRYPYEIRGFEQLDLPSSNLDDLGVTEAEVSLAEQLISTIQSDWNPEQYRDTYREDLLDLIKRKSEGETVEAPPEAPTPGKVVDIAELLKRSVEEARRAKASGEG